MASTPVIDTFLAAIEHARIGDCDAWSADATVDATVPNWRMELRGADAIRASTGAGSPIQGGSRSSGGIPPRTGSPRSWNTP